VAQRGRLRASLDAAGEDALLRVGADIVAVTHLDRIYWPGGPSAGRRRSPSAITCAISSTSPR